MQLLRLLIRTRSLCGAARRSSWCAALRRPSWAAEMILEIRAVDLDSNGNSNLRISRFKDYDYLLVHEIWIHLFNFSEFSRPSHFRLTQPKIIQVLIGWKIRLVAGEMTICLCFNARHDKHFQEPGCLVTRELHFDRKAPSIDQPHERKCSNQAFWVPVSLRDRERSAILITCLLSQTQPEAFQVLQPTVANLAVALEGHTCLQTVTSLFPGWNFQQRNKTFWKLEISFWCWCVLWTRRSCLH